MFGLVKALVVGAFLALPSVALAAEGQRLSDRDYCEALSALYVRYVGRSEAGPHAPVRPDAVAGVALAKCHEGDYAAAIPVLERKLLDARMTLPPRGG